MTPEDLKLLCEEILQVKEITQQESKTALEGFIIEDGEVLIAPNFRTFKPAKRCYQAEWLKDGLQEQGICYNLGYVPKAGHRFSILLSREGIIKSGDHSTEAQAVTDACLQYAKWKRSQK